MDPKFIRVRGRIQSLQKLKSGHLYLPFMLLIVGILNGAWKILIEGQTFEQLRHDPSTMFIAIGAFLGMMIAQGVRAIIDGQIVLAEMEQDRLETGP